MQSLFCFTYYLKRLVYVMTISDFAIFYVQTNFLVEERNRRQFVRHLNNKNFPFLLFV